MRRQDAQAAILAHELEHHFDSRLVYTIAVKIDLEPQITTFRIHVGSKRQGIRQDGDMDDFPHVAEIADERQGIHTIAQHITGKAQRDVPIVACHRAVI